MSLKDVECVKNHFILFPKQVRPENSIEMEQIVIKNNETVGYTKKKKFAVQSAFVLYLSLTDFIVLSMFKYVVVREFRSC